MPAWCLTAMIPEVQKPFAALLTALAAFALAALPAIAQLPVRSANPLAGENQRVLPIEEAFPWYVSEANPGQYRITFNPAPEHYLYRHAFGFRLQAGGEEQPLNFQLPMGLEKNDQFFGDVVAYYDQVSVDLNPGSEISAGAVLLIEFQGCADWGFCYPPQQARFPFPAR